MSTPVAARTRTRPTPWWALWGLLIGTAITLPATFLALTTPTGEALHPYLVPGTALLRPLADAAASWPGLVNMVIASLVNGLVYAIGAGLLGALASRVRHR